MSLSSAGRSEPQPSPRASHRRDPRRRFPRRVDFHLSPLEPRLLFAVTPVVHMLDLGAVSAASVLVPGVAAQSAAASLYFPTASFTASKPAVADVPAVSVTPFNLNISALRATLAVAPMEFTSAAATNPLTLELPTPDGSLERFRVVDSPIMDPALAAQFPDIQTYSGTSIDDPGATLRLDFTPLGFHAQVLSPDRGAYYIDPYFQNDPGGTHVAYYQRDLDPSAAGAGLSLDDDDALDPAGGISLGPTPTPPSGSLSIGTTLRTFRIAVAADGEYTQAVGGGTVAGAQAAIVTAINRVDGVYESELDVRLTLVANNAQLIFADPTTDPYSNTSADVNVNTNVINTRIGAANYDVGQVFTTGSGGLAYVGVVGNVTYKGGGTTGKPNPVGDAFYIDYVAHELGHEFGAQHTFNTANDTANRNPSTAYEPGSGSTIMGYAGLEGADDLQPHSDPYFAATSLDEIQSFLATIPTVGASAPTGNHAPTLASLANYTIPASTPFTLTASASDIDGDLLTYDWEERDLGPATNLTSPDNGSSPLFRVYDPTTSPSRTLPQLASILSGANNTLAPTGGGYVERLYTLSRTSTWRVVVRDNHPAGGGIATADMTLTVINTGASFSITSPNTSAVSWTAGTRQTVAWNVAGTTGNGINATNVNILLSTDGGQTFNTTLASNVPNNGSASFTLPTNLTATTAARIKIVPTNNVFFDISDANFTLVVPVTTGALSGTVFQDNNGDGLRDGNPASRPSPAVPKAIPDPGTATSTLLISGFTGTITDLNFLFSITHTFDSDLVGSLTSPQGTTVTLFANVGAAGHNFTGTLLDDQAAASIITGVAPFSGAYTPAQALAAFNGQNPNGTWTFTVVDQEPGDSGTIQSWSLSLTTTLEPLLPNVTVYLDANHNNAYDPDTDPATTTDANGAFSFANLPPTNYSVGVVYGTSFVPTTNPLLPLTVTLGNTASAAFALFPTRFTGSAAGNNAFALTNSSGLTQIWENASTTGPATYQVSTAFLGSATLTFAPSNSAGADSLTLTNPSNPINFLAGAGNDSLTLAAGSMTFTTDLGAASAALSLTLRPNTTAAFTTSQHLASLALQDNATATLATGGNLLLSTANLSLAPTATLDLADNDALIDYPDPNNSPLAALRQLIANAATTRLLWSGVGITSSAAHALATHQFPGTPTTLAISESALYKARNGPTFDGQPIDDTAVLIKYTYIADATLDGKVDDSDVDVLYANYQDSTRPQNYTPFYTNRTFTDADFTFDGKTDNRDLDLLSLAYDPLATVL